MKASNIILFSMIGSITLLIITGAMQIRFGDDTHNGKNPLTLQKQVVDLADFRYVEINNVNLTLTLTSGSKSEFEIEYEEGYEKPVFHYAMNGDTLVIDSLEWAHKHIMYNYKLVITEKVTWIGARNSSLHIQDLVNDSLKLDLDKANVNIDDENKFHTLGISGSDGSHINVYSSLLDTLTINLDNSQMYVHGTVGKLKGSMQNRSELSVKEVNEFAFKKDGSCRLNHWN